MRTVLVSTKHFLFNAFVQVINFLLFAAAFLGAVHDGAAAAAFLGSVLGSTDAAVLIQQI
jgi:hypothetical protein